MYYRLPSNEYLGPNTPPEIKKLAEKAFPSSSQRSYLFEAWVTSSESWKNSKLLVALKSRSKHARRGLRRWYTFDEMVKKWGADIAEDIKNTKLGDEKLREREVRQHPELPHRQDSGAHVELFGLGLRAFHFKFIIN